MSPTRIHGPVVDSSRGQSETLGTMLLIGVVVLAVSTIGVVTLLVLDTDGNQTTMIDVEVTSQSVTVLHAGGDPVDASNLELRIEFDGDIATYDAVETGAPDPFRSGQEWVIDENLPYEETDVGQRASVSVVHTGTGELLFSGARTIPG